jgi:hypothetical protein
MADKLNLRDEFQRRIANLSIGASTGRGRPPGTIANGRLFLSKLPLANVGRSGSKFPEILDQLTEELAARFPRGARRDWGLARKFINIFLEEAAGNYCLRRIYRLDRVEKYFEVPLDSHVAKGLNKESKRSLPKWRGIKNLTKPQSRKYQEAAQEIATSQKMLRIHLDLKYWRLEE